MGQLSGIISFGDDCGSPQYPGIYTDVSMYKDWINEVLSTERLPDYMYSPFAQQLPFTNIDNDKTENNDGKTIKCSIALMTLCFGIISTFIL